LPTSRFTNATFPNLASFKHCLRSRWSSFIGTRDSFGGITGANEIMI